MIEDEEDDEVDEEEDGNDEENDVRTWKLETFKRKFKVLWILKVEEENRS